jgi:Rne/Rng family ribonuclease
LKRDLLVERSTQGYAAALVEDHVLLDYVAAPEDGAGEPGAVHLARVAQLHAELGLAFLTLGGGATATVELGKTPPRQGDAILVQVTAAAAAGKPARVRRSISLDGHLVILRPGGQSIRYARAAEASFGSAAMEEALRMRLPDGFGMVVRSAARRAPDEAVAIEIDRLVALWRAIEARAAAAAAPAALFVEGAPRRAVLPLLRAQPDRVVVTDKAALRECELLGVAARLELDAALFDSHGVAEQLSAARAPGIDLAGGGTLAIEATRALTVVDIDGAGATADDVNLRAAREIARQLRLRDVVGTVIIDFLRSRSQSQRRIERALADATALDRRRVNLLGWTRGGLYELRRGEVLER